jgi:type IV pilus assembly protein PilV
MKNHLHAKRQSGSMLLEALIGIAIFAFGIVGLIGVQTASIRAATDSKYRIVAAEMADKLIGNMWASTLTPATLTASYASPNGAGYLAWLGSSATAGSVLETGILPGAENHNPVVTVVPVTVAGNTTSSLVTVTIYWKATYEDATMPEHSYSITAQLGT